MSLDLLGVGYLGLGAAIALVLAVTLRGQKTSDTLLVVVLWPLWAPLVIAQRHSLGDDERELLSALSRAQSSPLAQVLPDAETARVLAARLREATERLGELDALLDRPDFDPATVETRVKELAARGANAAAATAQLRVRTLGQLRSLRVRYRSELDEVHELIAQLVTQAELVRLQPSIAKSSADLVQELVARVEGLGDLFAYQSSIEDGELEYKSAPAR
ncbi:MAG: hypothetical protein M4D80_26320 [Myxococcota bacterium]|nr:hypothetical protein [Myxococcota bacterium]